MKLNPETVMKKLEEWNEVTQFAMILQNEGYKSGLNKLSKTSLKSLAIPIRKSKRF